MSYEQFFLALAVLAGLYLFTRAWVWCGVLFLSAVAAYFAMVASIIHFQIFGAVGFFILGSILWTVFRWVVEAKYDA